MSARQAGQAGLTIWLTGLPASGKTTLAGVLAARLAERGHSVEVLDADALRQILTPRPRYDEEERKWFYGVLVYLADLLSRHGVTVLLAATAHRRAYRELARGTLPRFAEVYVSCPIGECRRRDRKELYQRARLGLIQTLPGEQEPYEAPEAPSAVANTELLDPEEAADSVIHQLEQAGALEQVAPLARARES